MKKGTKIGINLFIFFIVICTLIFINWQHIFGGNRMIANVKAIYQLEIKGKDIAKTTNVDNDTLYIIPKNHLDTYIKVMSKEGYILSEKDVKHNRLVFDKDHICVAIHYKQFAYKYIIIETTFSEVI
jgi:hypothetical protein